MYVITLPRWCWTIAAGSNRTRLVYPTDTGLPAESTLSQQRSDVYIMACCGKKKLLMVMTSVCACASFSFLCLAVATDYWLYAMEVVQHSNGTNKLNTHTGLWKRCSVQDDTPDKVMCSFVPYFIKIDKEGLGTTDAIIVSMRNATIFPLISLLILLIGEIVCFLGHCNNKKKVLTFVAGILFVIGGLVTLIGIILFIGAITGEVGAKATKSGMEEPKFKYSYGSSFMFTVGSFIVSELTGVLSVYLYISRYKHAYKKKQERHHCMLEANERPYYGVPRVQQVAPPQQHNRRPLTREHSRDHSRDNSPCHSETYYTYTPVSETSKEMSNYTFPRDASFPREVSRHTISTTADTHPLSADHSVHSVRELDSYRRTTPV